jgi:hypothetical protein
MQFIVTVNQVKALEWGLNAQQAMLFSFIYSVPSWARPVVMDGKTYYAISKEKITDELPLLTDKPDTAYRILKALELVEVIDLSSTPKITLVRLTEKGRTWNTSENYPSKVGKKSEVRSEKSPTNQDTNNQDTNNQKPICDQRDEHVPYESIFKAYADILPEKPQPKIKDEARKKAIRCLWNSDKRFQKPEFWDSYFRHVRRSDFLMRTPTLAFDWLMKPANFKKVVEGNYIHESA